MTVGYLEQLLEPSIVNARSDRANKDGSEFVGILLVLVLC